MAPKLMPPKTVAPKGEIKQVRLDDADLNNRNEALMIENEILKENLEDSEYNLTQLAKRIEILYGVQAIGRLTPDQVHSLYAEIEKAIEAFVGPMDKLIRENEQHKDRVEKAMFSEVSAKAFRVALRHNEELQAAAINPETCVIDVWTAYIWRFLLQSIFAEDAILEFYSGKGQTASYYIKNLDEIEYLMTQAKPPAFGLYSRRLWKRQALAAIFSTADFEWVRTIRAAKIEGLSEFLKRAFAVFAKPLGEENTLQHTRKIVTAAVALSERIMIQADDIWAIELQGVTGSEEDFYDNLDDFELKPVGSFDDFANAAPLNTLTQRVSLDEIQARVKKLCVVTPALRFRHIEPDGESYKEAVHKVKPQVLVALKSGASPEEGQDEYVCPDELVFHNMAKSLGLIQDPSPTQE